jgi:MSHA pilin protein MshA
LNKSTAQNEVVLEEAMNTQRGFTLIELVMVIVILGILAASAIPSFVNVSGDARQAATDGIAGALGSASAINYAVRSIDGTDGVAVADCQDVASALEGGLDADYAITASGIADGATTTCTVSHTDGETATFVGHGIS